MTLKMLNTNYPQCMVFPNNKLYRGNDVYNATTLERLQDEEPLIYYNGEYIQYLSCGMYAGKNSKNFYPNGVYQSKYDPNIIFQLECGTTNYNGYFYDNAKNSSCFYKRFFNKNIMKWFNYTSSSNNIDSVFIPIYEDKNYIYFLSKYFTNYSSIGSSSSWMTIYKYNKSSSSFSNYYITNPKRSASYCSYSYDTSIRVLGVSDGILSILYPYENAQYTIYYSAFRLLEINIETGIVLREYISEAYNYISTKYYYTNTDILPSKVYTDSNGKKYAYVPATINTTYSDTNTNNWFIFKHCFTTEGATSPVMDDYVVFIMTRHPTTSLTYTSTGYSYDFVSKWNGKLYEKSDTDGNKYLVILNRADNNKDYGYLTVHKLAYTSVRTSYSDSSNTNMPLIQEFSGITDFVECDEDEDTFIYGNGMTITKIKWNENTGRFDELSNSYIGDYKGFQLADSGELWFEMNTSNNNSDRFLRVFPGQGVILTAIFEKEMYRYAGTDINTSLQVSLKDQDGSTVSTEQTIQLVGNCQFTDTKSKTRKVTFTGSQAVTLGVTITGAGAIDCLLVNN